ncbi:hypothetical protein HYW43_00700 [Candidatus Daviesbacteria bacterium]|nr:hypothetical protein [Candidatus Daviesbacteria bacterium]
MKYFLKILPALIFWGGFAFVVLQVPYPDSLTQANFNQVIPFFVSLYLALVFTLNILFRNILLSASICLSLIFLLILKALDSLNIVTGILIIVATGLLASYFRKVKRKGLTKQAKLHKLTQLLK